MKKWFRKIGLAVSLFVIPLSASAYNFSGNFNLVDGGDFSLFSDNAVTKTFFIDSATGSFGIPSGQKFFVDDTLLAGDTYIQESSANNLLFQVGGSGTLNLTVDSIKIPSTFKLFLDGGGDTYVQESSANNFRLVVGNATTLESTASFITSYFDFGLAATKKLYLDGGGDTYIQETSANDIRFFAGGSQGFEINGAGGNVNVGSSFDLTVTATKKLYLDGGVDTYITEGAANRLDFYAGGVNTFSTTSTVVGINVDAAMSATKRFFLDGGTESYLAETSADTVDIVAGNTTVASFKETSSGNGEVLLDDVNPPTANYMNANSGVKAWAKISSAGAIVDSYNVSSSSKDATGRYTVNWNTDFASTGYSVVVTVLSSIATPLFPVWCINAQAVGSTSVAIAQVNITAPSVTDMDAGFWIQAIGDQ